MTSTFLATGQLPMLFSNDEEDGLLQVNGNMYRSTMPTGGGRLCNACTLMMLLLK